MTHKAVITLATMKRAIKAVKQTGAEMAIECTPDGVVRLVPITEKPKELDYQGKIKL